MIKIANVTKKYGGFTAVSDASFEVPTGSITGFLGPNGAGKSTLLRSIVGLTTPDSGTITIAGSSYQSLPEPARVAGVLLDASAQHNGRTGAEVLNLTRIGLGLPKNAVAEMLDIVGLTQAESKRRVGNYSLGMRQRLGIANALFGKPQYLILDEPANGLDPAGIKWMRNLLSQFAAAGGTVLLSSHLIHEIAAIANDLVVIGNGKILAAGSTKELLTAKQTQVTATDTVALSTALQAAGLQVRMDGQSILTDAPAEAVGKIALSAQIILTSLTDAGNGNVEELFFQLTADSARKES